MLRNRRAVPLFLLTRSALNAVRLLLAASMLGGVVYATPIVSFNDAELQQTKPAASSQAPAATAVALETSASALGKFSEAVSSRTIPDECLFTSGCSSTMKVPEPQSLVMVGSGLLGMAGVIRRKLLR